MYVGNVAMIFDPSHSSVHGIFSRNGRVSVRKTYSRCTQFWLCQKVAIIANAKRTQNTQPNTIPSRTTKITNTEKTRIICLLRLEHASNFSHLICSIVVLDVDIMYLCWMCTLCCRIQLKIAICQRKYPRLVDELDLPNEICSDGEWSFSLCSVSRALQFKNNMPFS